jgi:hypothetical protein
MNGEHLLFSARALRLVGVLAIDEEGGYALDLVIRSIMVCTPKDL